MKYDCVQQLRMDYGLSKLTPRVKFISVLFSASKADGANLGAAADGDRFSQ